MSSVQKSFENLTSSVSEFKNEYKLHYPNDPMSETWSVRDVLCHLTYWHRYYLKNLTAESKGSSFIMPKKQLYLMNREGVEKMRQYPDTKLLSMLTYANKRLGEISLGGKVKQMTYWEGRKPYSLLEFLEIVNRHINAHTRGIKRKRKK